MAAYLTPMNLTTLQAYVRNYTLERTGDVGLITDTELTDIINAASRMVWARIATKYPDVFTQRSPSNLTVTAGSPVAFSTISATVGANIYKVLFVAVGPTGATLAQLSPLNEFDRVTFRHIYESVPTGQLAPALPYRFYIEGQNLFFTPVTSGNFDCRVTWVSQPQDLVAGADVLWGGLQPAYHDFVAVLASMLVYHKDGNLQSGFNGILQYIDQILVEHFGPPMNPMGEDPKENRP